MCNSISLEVTPLNPKNRKRSISPVDTERADLKRPQEAEKVLDKKSHLNKSSSSSFSNSGNVICSQVYRRKRSYSNEKSSRFKEAYSRPRSRSRSRERRRSRSRSPDGYRKDPSHRQRYKHSPNNHRRYPSRTRDSSSSRYKRYRDRSSEKGNSSKKRNLAEDSSTSKKNKYAHINLPDTSHEISSKTSHEISSKTSHEISSKTSHEIRSKKTSNYKVFQYWLKFELKFNFV